MAQSFLTHCIPTPPTPPHTRSYSQVVIFVKSVQRAKALNALLNECNFPSVCIHRGMQQNERISVYSQFKENKVGRRASKACCSCLDGKAASKMAAEQQHQ